MQIWVLLALKLLTKKNLGDEILSVCRFFSMLDGLGRGLCDLYSKSSGEDK